MKTTQIAIMAAAMVVAVQARATLFELDYSDTYGNSLKGFITATSLGGGEYLATAGTVTVTAGAAVGSYTLVANPLNPPGVFPYNVSNEGGPGYANDILYYPYSPNSTYVDIYGLLGFQSSTGYLNIYSDNPPATSYGLWAGDDAANPLVNVDGVTTTSLTPVPEPTTVVAGAMLLLPFGMSTLRMFRKSRTA